MSYLLDTNVISETVKSRPHPAVTRWLESVPSDALYLSVLTLGELRKGVSLLPKGTKKERLGDWLEHALPAWFENRLLAVDAAVANTWGNLSAKADRTLPSIDALIAATALHHGLRIVTRNTSDFDLPGVEIVDPWHDGIR